MSVGLGIFLGCVFLGTVFLYLKTASSWNWKKIGKRTLITVGILVAGSVVLALAVFGYDRWEQRAQVVTSLKGIAIGEKLADVVFKHGAFEKREKKVDDVRKYQDEEDYEQKDKRVGISVRSGVVVSINYICGNESDYTSLNRISCDDSGDKIKELFQNRVRVLCSKKSDEGAQFRRVYDVVEYGTRYLVGQNKVAGFLTTNKRELESLVGLNWDECK